MVRCVRAQPLQGRISRAFGGRPAPSRPPLLDGGAGRADRRPVDDVADSASAPGAAPAHPLDNVDDWRGPTASQASGLTLAAAWAVIDAVQAVARELHVAMSCAVVDAGDQLVAFERMDGADLVGITLARDKAFSALVEPDADA